MEPDRPKNAEVILYDSLDEIEVYFLTYMGNPKIYIFTLGVKLQQFVKKTVKKQRTYANVKIFS